MKTYNIEQIDSGYILEVDGWRRAFENHKTLGDFIMAKLKEECDGINSKTKKFSIGIDVKDLIEHE